MSKKTLLSSLLLSSLVILQPTVQASTTPNMNKILANAPGLNPVALKTALAGFAYAKAHGDVSNPHVLTVIDFSQSSNKNRLWLINMDNDQVLMNMLVAQGKNSGSGIPTQFSNAFNSKETSLGVYTTSSTFYGKHGLSMHLNGLEPGINNNARARAVEVHSANYVTPQFVAAHGRAGGSWGCFAMNPSQEQKYISYAKGGSVIFAYAKQELTDHNIAGYSSTIA